jgi:putative ABC transport system permease protein
MEKLPTIEIFPPRRKQLARLPNMLSTRWIKLIRDLQATPWRIAIMLLTIALGLFAFTGLLVSFSLLTREVRTNYLATNPATASFHVDHLNSELLDRIRLFPGVDQAQTGAVYKTRFSTQDGTPNPLLIFVIDNFNRHDINKITPEAGAWPQSQHSILLERDSLARKALHIGDTIQIPLRDGSSGKLSISGSVHDPAMPVPSYETYAYATRDTLTALGINLELTELQVTFRDKSLDSEAAQNAAGRLALWIESQGHKVSRIRVPPPGEHPHQGIILSVLGIFLLFSAIAFALSAFVIATIIDGLMAQLVRQIGIMKSIGASNMQIAGLYLTLIFILGAVATAIALPTGINIARVFAKMVLGFLNFDLQSPALPFGLYGVLVTTGIGLPLCAAAVPIFKTVNANAQDSLTQMGAIGSINADLWIYRLPFIDRTLVMTLRNCFRRRGRLLMILSLLSSAGAMFITSLNLQKASQEHLAHAAAERRYDIEVALLHTEQSQNISKIIGNLEGVTAVEEWISTAVTPHRPDGLTIESVHADGGHGAFLLNVMPEHSQMIKLTMVEGQWPATMRTGDLILNDKAQESFSDARVGNFVTLNVSGTPLRLKVAGIARQKMAGKMAYVSASTFQALRNNQQSHTSYRISTQLHDERSLRMISEKIEAALDTEQLPVSQLITETQLRHEVDGHFTILIKALRFIALLIAGTGAFALASVMSIHVTERTREIGIMRSIGASSAVIVRNIIIEGIFISFISWMIALVLCVPLSTLASAYIGGIIFNEAFPLAISGAAIGIWFLIAITTAALASLYPARKAVKLSIRDCFSY